MSVSGSSARPASVCTSLLSPGVIERPAICVSAGKPMNLSSPASISALLKKYGLRPRRRFGQNFLVDGNTLGRIVAAGLLEPGDGVLEIGAGLGVLTQALAGAVTGTGQVVAVEVDRDLLPALQETVGGLPQVQIQEADALSLDWPVFLQTHLGERAVTVVANIPYNITTPLLTSLLDSGANLARLVFLVQKEVAQRLSAPPGSSDYGSISVFAQFHAKVETVGIVSRRVFLPSPDVDSAIIRLTPHPAPPVEVTDRKQFFAVVRAAFGQRRKSLLNALSGDPSLAWSRARAETALQTAGIDPLRRGETLSLAEFALLAHAPE